MIISYSTLFFQTLDKKIPSSHEISLGHGLKAVRCFFFYCSECFFDFKQLYDTKNYGKETIFKVHYT